MIGESLGPYKILELLGAGGMGEVYRARDTKLDRDVAIKVLPDDLAADADRLARFKREAKLLAALNHSNIGAIYGLEESDDARFLVLELILGETLERRLTKGALPAPEALEIARQIAEALEAAHDEGIIHRDVKPANVLLTPKGGVKVLDFGIAKSTVLDTGVAEAELATSLTMDGTLIGTPPYMAPEQIRGKEADKRADIWAFGCVLYEMLAGKGAFVRETVADTLAAILDAEPDWEAIPGSTPPAVGSLLRRCMRKDPNRRLRDIGDARIELEEPAADPALTSERVPSAEALRSIRLRGVTWSAAAGLALLSALTTALLVFGLAGRSPVPERAEVSRWEISLGQDQELLLGGRSHPLALSPDGSQLGYVATDGVKSQLFVRSIDEFDAVALTGTDGARNPFFSPDGEWIGFFAEGELRKVPSGGGAVHRICDAPLDNLGSAWREDGTIVFASYGSGLWRVAADGGDPTALTRVDPESGEIQHRWPQFLPGNRLLMTVDTTRGSRVVVVDLRDGKKSLVADVSDVAVARYLPTGHLLFAQSSVLQVIPFDVTDASVRGAPVTIVEGVTALSAQGVSYFAVSESGTLAYLPGAGDAGTRLVWVDFTGEATPLEEPWTSHMMPRISPSGSSVALTVGSALGQRVVEILDLERGSTRRLSFEGSNALSVWSHDSRRIVFSSSRDGGWNLYWRAADGSDEATRLLAGEYELWPHSFSPDGKALAYWEIHPENARDIWILPLEGDQTPRPFLVTPYNERAPVFSPDGRWIAYISDESGRDEVYVRPYPGPGGQTTVSTEGGVEPTWAPDGQRLFYRNADRMMVVLVDTGTGFSASKPSVLFEGRYDRGVTGNRSYDITPEGDRFLMIQPLGDRTTASFRVILNWFEELKERVPTGR